MKIQLSILIILFFILFGCILPPNECEKVDLSPEEKEWFDVYKVGQHVIFTNSVGVSDTLIVNKITNGYTICYGTEHGYRQYNIVILRMRLNHNELDLKGMLRFQKSIYSDATEKSFQIAGLNWHYDTLAGNLKFEKIYLKSKKDSVDTYQLNEGNRSGSADGDAVIKSFNWSKRYGLVRYVTKENETYEILK